MLVLNRKEGEQIVVPECNLTMSILGIFGRRVRIGISAPAHLIVRRGELTHEDCDLPCECVEAAAAALEDPLKSVRVLIADTDEYLMETYRERLGRDGFDVVTATGGVECIERLRECVPDVLVLEPSIPWGGGDGVLAEMHEELDLPSVPVIILTFGRDRGLLYRLAPFQADDYQVKPLSAQKLAGRIRAIVSRREAAATTDYRGGTSQNRE
jgi:carbon storage regulator CsrA